MPYASKKPIARVLRILTLGMAMLGVLAGAQTPAPQPRPALANPASQNCIDKGGQVSMDKNGKGGQFGVCIFPDQLQCEEWAMMRGECRVGGIKVTGYVTPAARYCAITGGAYEVTSASNTPNEQGTCTFKGGKTCNAKAYFDGACSRDSARPVQAKNSINARFTCNGGKTIDATFINDAKGSVTLVLSDGRSMRLPQARSGSGARYANRNESVIFWNKGDTAFIDEGGKMTYENCGTNRT